MRDNKLLIIFIIVGALVVFSLWPVQSGLKPIINCPRNADCPNPPEYTSRILYLEKGQPWHNDGGFVSRKEYCQLAAKCTNYHADIPLSLIIGAGIGAGVSLVLRNFLPRKGKGKSSKYVH